MRHICVIGDSSAAALKAGWSEIAASHDDTELTFFASPGDSLRALELSGRCLTIRDHAVADRFAMTSGGLSIIDLDEYDEIWIAGLGITFASSVEVYAGFRSEEHANLGDEQVLVSQDAFDLMVKARVANAVAPALVQLIEPIVGNVRVICRPLPCHDIVSVDPAWAAAIGDDAPALADSFVRAMHEVAGNTMSIETQPSSLGESPLTTKPEYSIDAIALDMVSTAPSADVWHMNAAFGVEMLQEVLARTIDPAGASAPAPDPCADSILCSSEMLQRPPSVLAEYFKEVRRRYPELRSATVVMANVTRPQEVEMVQYLTAAKKMLVLWSEPEHGEVSVPAWCQVSQWDPAEIGENPAQQLTSVIGVDGADIVVDCNARSETFAALSRLAERSGTGYLAITESSPVSDWQAMSAELCLDMLTHHIGRRDVVMDDRHIWATWTQSLPRIDFLGMRPDLVDSLLSQEVGP